MTTNHDALREAQIQKGMELAVANSWIPKSLPHDQYLSAWALMVEFVEAIAASKPEPISYITEAVTCTVIEVEKLLCEKLGKQWRPSGMSIQTLVDELAASKPWPQDMDAPGERIFQNAGELFDALGIKPEQQAQAQAAEPEVVAEVYRAHYGNRHGNIGFDTVRLTSEKVVPGDKLITLQAHREAMADLRRHKEDWKSSCFAFKEQRNALQEAVAELTVKWTSESEEVQRLLLKLEAAGQAIAKRDAALDALKVAAVKCAAVIRTRQRKRDDELTSGEVTDAVCALDSVESAITKAQEARKL